MDIFEISSSEEDKRQYQPLAERMRPRNLQEFVGQRDVIKKNLLKMVKSGRMMSMILYGAPGTGKTTLAKIIANTTKSCFQKVNAALSGIADVKNVVKMAEEQRKYYQRQTILFIDEIHRFNKNQQDVLLPYVEEGLLTLIGATTENPFFEVNPALLSRLRIVKLNRLTEDDIKRVIKTAITDKERGLGSQNVNIEESAVEAIADFANGDARIALNILEQAASLNEDINLETLKELLGERVQRYDKRGENHFDTISAFIKSMRGSAPDAAIYYLAKMIGGGEDINYIARRVVICAAEDVGNADPMALILANAAAQAAQYVGLPEARIILAQAVTYVASAPKSNAAYLAIDAALDDVKNKDCGEIPIHLRDTGYKGSKFFHNGEGYLYPHDFNGHFVKQQYLPTKITNAKYYKPTESGAENNLKVNLQKLWADRF